MDNIEILETISQSLHSTVYKVNYQNHLYALKSMTYDIDGIKDIALREIVLLKKINHPYIIKYQQIFVCHNHISLLFNYYNQDLKNYIPQLTQQKTIKIFHQICLGVQYLHQHDIIHRDLKPENILIDKDDIKICDFGLSRIISNQVTYSYHVVTLWYRAPEILLKLDYSLPIDIWSLGCILVEMMTKKVLYKGKNVKDMLQLIEDVKINVTHDLALVKQMLAMNDYERINIDNILKYLSYHYTI